MTNETKSILEDYITKNPNLNYSEIATCIKEDGASELTHRSLRLYAKLIKEQLTNTVASTPSDQTEEKEDEPDSAFVDLSPVLTDDGLLGLAPIDTTGTVKKSRALPKILVLDIETSLIEAMLFDTGKQYIGSDQLKNTTYVIGWGAKWLYDAKTMSDFVTPAEALARDDKRVIASAWALLNEADYVIGHNVGKFDTNIIRTRSIYHKMIPFLPFRIIDTLTFAKKYLKAPGLSLNFLSQLFCNKAKLRTERQMWIDINNGSQTAIDQMKAYCINDVGLTEEVYFEIRPYMTNHPNIAVLIDDEHPCCPVCGGYDFDPVAKYYTTQQNAYEQVRCTSCGAPNRLRTSIITKEKKKNMVIPVAH